eukprot:3873897-Alexandrium_andersonii.AAC.1
MRQKALVYRSLAPVRSTPRRPGGHQSAHPWVYAGGGGADAPMHGHASAKAPCEPLPRGRGIGFGRGSP